MNEQGAAEIIRVLMVEANEEDAAKILGVLRDAGMQITSERVQSAEALSDALQQFKPDVVLSDYALPEIAYRSAIKIVQALRPRTPVIVVSGPLRNECSGTCVRAGADSFVSKLNLFVLPAL